MIRTALDTGALRGSVGANDATLRTDPGDVDPHRRYLTVADAAVRLSTTSTALRARCRRNAHRVGRDVVACLGAGVTAYKLGVSWRLRIDPP
jgi:hypothetical protein